MALICRPIIYFTEIIKNVTKLFLAVHNIEQFLNLSREFDIGNVEFSYKPVHCQTKWHLNIFGIQDSTRMKTYPSKKDKIGEEAWDAGIIIELEKGSESEVSPNKNC